MGNSDDREKKSHTAKEYILHEKAQEDEKIQSLRNMVQNAAAAQSDYVGSAVGSREHLDSMQRQSFANQSEATQRNTMEKNR